MLACLLEGPPGSGKSALAATIAMESDFPFVKVLSAEGMVGFSEQAKSSQITKVGPSHAPWMGGGAQGAWGAAQRRLEGEGGIGKGERGFGGGLGMGLGATADSKPVMHPLQEL